MPANAHPPSRATSRRLILVATAAAGAFMPLSAGAADRYWVAGNGTWSNPAAWSAAPTPPGGAGVPVNDDNAFIDSTGTLIITRDNTVADYDSPGLSQLQLTGTGASPVTINQTASVMAAIVENIGLNGSGEFDQSGGGNVAGTVFLGVSTTAPGAGSYNLSGGTLSASTLVVGGSGAGIFNLTTGQASFGNIQILSAGQFISTGGSISINGPVTVDGGTFTVPGILDLFTNSPTFTVDDNGYASTAGGVLLDGTLSLQSGGVFNSDKEIDLFSSNDRITLAGGQLNTTTVLLNGGTLAFTSGTLNITGATGLSVSSTGFLGSSINLSANQTLQVSNTLTIASSSTITLAGATLSASTINNSGLIIGHGMLIATSGLSNQGSITFSGGPVDVQGAATNSAVSSVFITSAASATFHNAVINQPGSQFKIDAGSTATFLGAVSGLAAFTGSGSMIFASTTTPGSIAATGTTVVDTAGNLTATSIRQQSLIVRGIASILPDGSSPATSVLQSLTIAGSMDTWTGQLDLTNNKAIVDYAGASPIAQIANQIKSGAANNWTGKGITSSTAHAVAIDPTNAHKTALGYAEASSIGASNFGGQAVDSTAVFIGYTLIGDANLDGVVNAQDFDDLASNYGAIGSAFWTQGDFNYDGVVNVVDFNALASNFNQSVQFAPALGTLVAEPACIGALIPLLAAVRRRR